MEDTVTRRRLDHRTLRTSLLIGVLVAGLASITAAQDAAQQQQQQQGQQQRTFATPEEGVAALVDALRTDDRAALQAVLGPGSDDIIDSGDPVADKNAKDEFLKEYDAKSELVPVDDETRVLSVGQSEWDLPIPLIKRDATWSFDLDEGRDELLNRRIGRNEANAVEAALAFIDAEREYASVDHNGDSILQYAQKFASSPGVHDGLYWPAQPGEEQSPLGPFFAAAQAEGYFQSQNAQAAAAGLPAQPEPYYGYYYKILTAQGPDAPGGAYDYVVDGKMIGGVAMVAYPAEYGVSGVMTFIVSHDGVVYQRDLGPETQSIASAMTAFNPDIMWERVQTPVGVASTP
jgi:hypothetical protein